MQQVGGRYRLDVRLGSSGAGVVWRAFDPVFGREVALKQLTLTGEGDANVRAVLRNRILREARLLARLSHPNIVTIYDIVDDSEQLWIVMEYLNGISLHDVLSQVGTLPPQSVAAIGRDLLAALQDAHRSGVLHGDVKPANVMLTNDRVVLKDFWVVQAGGLPASPDFMAPERIYGEGASREADMWAFGATIYAAVEGESPYGPPGLPSVLASLARGSYSPPHRAGVLQPVIEGLLRKDPRDRMRAEEVAVLLSDAGTYSREMIALGGSSDGSPTSPAPGSRVDPPSAARHPTHADANPAATALAEWIAEARDGAGALIFLPTDDGASEVEAAVVAVLEAFGIGVEERLPIIRASWLRRLRLRVRALAGSPVAKQLLHELEYAARVKILYEPVAGIDEKKSAAVASLITALESQPTAAIMISSILILKVDGVLIVRDLTPEELVSMKRNPLLVRDPAALLEQLNGATGSDAQRPSLGKLDSA
ncbi:protein kinase [Nonomuraea purpurea]|uniref:non-specific serine/threonine protein kinase n=1 Tax=Nonomuraea purpurea TaxID=1849276 RepID=A0ABV8GQF3_9ACTN